MTVDIINLLSGTQLPERSLRQQAVENAQFSFEALLEGELPERYAVAAFVAGLHRSPAVNFYLDLLEDETPELVGLLHQLLATALETAPSGPAAKGEGAAFSSRQSIDASVPDRLAAALDYAHFAVFRPADASPEYVQPLARVFDADEIVTLAQLVGFLAFQLRVVQGLSVLGGTYRTGDGKGTVLLKGQHLGQPQSVASVSPEQTWERGQVEILSYPDVVEPTRYVHHSLGWLPWVPDVSRESLTNDQIDAMIRPERVNSAYFRLLARNPAALRARTLTDLDIFYNVEGGLGRAERELAATVASRLNGCIFCASVHAGRTLEESEGRLKDVEALLDEGVEADLGSDLWNTIARATVALTRTPVEFSEEHLQDLRDLGLATADIIDVIQAAAFFNWANRLMLPLGTAVLPRRYR
ncbi:alkylhydroperoxidase domain protein [Rothia nasimurium]|uniref:alkylhydroperoxidase domain protein n=1 Tax=Rothia nasimurium TaxID=85336 RepID=UPI003BA15E9F